MIGEKESFTSFPSGLSGRARSLYLEKGFSCSESILHAVKDSGLVNIPDHLIHSISGLRSGIGGSGCVCGALMAAVLLVGYLYGEKDKETAEKLSAQFHDKFRAKFKSACCRVLTRKYADFKSPERKEFCAGLVEFMMTELEPILKSAHG